MVTLFSIFKQKNSSNQYQVYKYAKQKDRVQKKKVITDTCNVDARKAANTARKSLPKRRNSRPASPREEPAKRRKRTPGPGNQKPKNKPLIKVPGRL